MACVPLETHFEAFHVDEGSILIFTGPPTITCITELHFIHGLLAFPICVILSMEADPVTRYDKFC